MDISNRIDMLDYLRGFALMGIILVNIIPLLSVTPPEPGSLDASYWRVLYFFVEGRFYTIFTFLFGVGFYLFISRANAKGKNGYALFLRRILALFIFGLIHVQFQQGEALSIYAICSLFILPFYKANKIVNLVFGTTMLIVLSIFSNKIFMVVPLMLLGIAAGQFQVFERISHRLKMAVIFTSILFVLSGLGLIYQYQHLPVMTAANNLETQRFINIGITIGPVVSAFYIGVFILLLQIPIVRKVLSPLKSYGRTALTNYVSQTAFILLAGEIFDLSNRITYIQSFFLCVAIYIIQFIFTTLWLRFFRFGPFEWVWRMMTYLQVPPIRIKERG
ncbi:DUF418 domain-containing protein [Neobacillus sp. NRS-1170]|uniref:DUF418 domain-containing protein n=1 Tax=Neobacillus sp. NRS-1170 TaxID=3233898 RepID=UPI003D286D82